MKKRSLRVLPLAFLAVSVALGACNDRDRAADPLQPVRIEASRAAEGKLRKVQQIKNVTAVVVVQRIGSQGGTLVSGGHRLVVPAGAVSEPIVFRMRVREDAVEVDLTATGPKSDRENDVGSRGFAVPLRLELSYSGAESVSDPSRLQIAWVRDDGVLEALPSTVDPGARTVAAQLVHFSGYTLVMP